MNKPIAKQMAYRIGISQVPDYHTFRLERGTPFKRVGVPVIAIPQFKGVTLFSHTTSNTIKSFVTTIPTVSINWPSVALSITRGK